MKLLIMQFNASDTAVRCSVSCQNEENYYLNFSEIYSNRNI